MQIEHSMLHLLNTASQTLVCAQAPLPIKEEKTAAFLERKLSKALGARKRKQGSFQENSLFLERLRQYRDKKISFDAFSTWMAEHLYAEKSECSRYEDSAFLISEIVEEGRRYLIGIDQNYQSAMTCYPDQEQNNALYETTVLPNGILKTDFVFVIELSDFTLYVLEEKSEWQGKETTLLASRYLQATTAPSFEETQKVMETVGKTMSEKYDMDVVKVLPKMKQMMKEAVEAQSEIAVAEVTEVLFQEVPYAKNLFVEEVKSAGIAAKVSTAHCRLAKSNKVQKLLADAEIEITLPLEYLSQPAKFEIIEAADGTYSIQIKNITNLKSK